MTGEEMLLTHPLPVRLSQIMDHPTIQVGARRTAIQRRSRAKFITVMDVARDLLVAGGPQAVSTTNVAAGAGVSVGWLYTYFENRDALLEEILIGSLRGLDEAMEAAGLDLGGTDWRPKAEAGVKACMDYFSQDASFRAIWFSGEYSGRMLQANRLHDDLMAAWLASTITHLRPDAPRVSKETVAQVFVGMLDKGCDLAFRDDPKHANHEMIVEVQRASVAYLAAYLV